MQRSADRVDLTWLLLRTATCLTSSGSRPALGNICYKQHARSSLVITAASQNEVQAKKGDNEWICFITATKGHYH